MDDKLFEDFHPEDLHYAKQEFLSYLIFALSCFPHKTASPGYLGLAGNNDSLPHQWKTVRELFPNVKTPPFFIGPAEKSPFDPHSKNIILSHLFNYYHWKPENGDKQFPSHPFLIQKPKGIPLLLFQCHEEVLPIYFDSRPNHVSIPLLSGMKELVLKLAKNYNYLFSETLCFVTSQDWTFAMMTPQVTQASSHPEFHDFLEKSLTPYFEKEFFS